MGIHSRRMDNVILGVHNILVISHESPFNSSHHQLSSVEVGQTQLGLAVARVTTFNASPPPILLLTTASRKSKETRNFRQIKRELLIVGNYFL